MGESILFQALFMIVIIYEVKVEDVLNEYKRINVIKDYQ